MPEIITKQVEGFTKDDIYVGCVKKISASALAAGKYSHLGLCLENGNLTFKTKTTPDPRAGRFSRRNLEGTETSRKDLPKVPKTYSFEAPNFGDWSKGSHTVLWDRLVYRREFAGPKELEIEISLLDEEQKQEKVFVILFRVGEVLNRKDKKFRDDLFFNLNILQENIGTVNVFPANATRADYLKTVVVDWEILPPGKREEIIERLLSGVRAARDEIREKLLSRYDLLNELKPVAFIKGASGFRRYFGAQFAENLIAFENIEYGNAVYVMYENWESLSKRSRIDLLNGDRSGFDRVVHKEGWSDKLKRLIREKKEN